MIKGKNIVITGANSGIGLETLKLLANGDNTILAVDLRTDRIEALNQKNIFTMVCDVSTKENVDSIFKPLTKNSARSISSLQTQASRTTKQWITSTGSV